MTEQLSATTARRLLHRVAVGQAEGRTPSLTAAVGRDGTLLWCGAGGAVGGREPTADTQYRIGSLTKTFTAVLIMRLRDEGRLELTDRVSAHLPEPDLRDTTVGQLLTHSAELSSETPPPWWERVGGEVRPQLADVLGERAVGPHSGAPRFHYSNPGFAVLGALAARLRDADWFDLVRDEILVPAGMTRTTPMPEAPHALGWAVHPWADVLLAEPAPHTGWMAPAGQLWSTATDLCRFAAVLLGDHPEVLDPQTAAEMREPISSPTDDSWTGVWGLGIQLARPNDRLLFGHGGSMPGFVSAFWVSADEHLVGVALANATGGPQVSAVAADLIDAVASDLPRLPEPWEPMTDADPELLGLVGAWYWGTTPVALRLRRGPELAVTALGARARESRFVPAPDGTWRGLDGYYRGERLRVVRHADGAVSHLDIGSFVYTREPYPAGAPIPGGTGEGWR